MSMCPACNGLIIFQMECDMCQRPMTIYGRVFDYVDDYSAYEQYENDDGQRYSNASVGCSHFIGCEHCDTSSIYTFQET